MRDYHACTTLTYGPDHKVYLIYTHWIDDRYYMVWREVREGKTVRVYTTCQGPVN